MNLLEMWNLFLHVFLGRKITKLLGTMAHACYLSTWEVDGGGLGRLSLAGSQIQDQSGLHETPF